MYKIISSLIFLCMVCPVYLKCNVPKRAVSFPTDDKWQAFCIGRVLRNKCSSKKNQDVVLDVKSAAYVIPKGAVTPQTFMGVIDPIGKNQKFIAWNGPRDTSESDVKTGGKIYILDVTPTTVGQNIEQQAQITDVKAEYGPGSVLTYYSCNENNDNENIYIAQLSYNTDIKAKGEQALNEAKNKLAKMDVPAKFKTMSCDDTW